MTLATPPHSPGIFQLEWCTRLLVRTRNGVSCELNETGIGLQANRLILVAQRSNEGIDGIWRNGPTQRERGVLAQLCVGILQE